MTKRTDKIGSLARGAAFAAALLLALLCTGVARADPITPAQQVAAMGRGVNILGADPMWRDPRRARFQTRHMRVVRDGGFSTVRINLQAFSHMDAQNNLQPQFLATLDLMIGAALSQGLTVILDEHDYNACASDVDACRVKLMLCWEQLAERYKHAPDNVVFEILNEPNRALDPLWNDILLQGLGVIRRTNPDRNVIIGPVSWNNYRNLDQLNLPADDHHIIVTVHYYLPMEFTHQGASWVPQFNQLGVTWGTPAERATLRADFDAVQQWSRAHDRPILLGEFGAYDRGPLPSRVAYTEAVAREAEAHGFAWTYWQFDSDFVVYDMAHDRWNAPIHDALIPSAAH